MEPATAIRATTIPTTIPVITEGIGNRGINSFRWSSDLILHSILRPSDLILGRRGSYFISVPAVCLLFDFILGAPADNRTQIQASNMIKARMFKRSKQLLAFGSDVKWDIVGLLLFVPLESQSINRYLGSEPFLPRLGGFREPLIEMLLLAGMGIFMSVRGAERLRAIESLRASEAP